MRSRRSPSSAACRRSSGFSAAGAAAPTGAARASRAESDGEPEARRELGERVEAEELDPAAQQRVDARLAHAETRRGARLGHAERGEARGDRALQAAPQLQAKRRSHGGIL
jgi:hypothetical protein